MVWDEHLEEWQKWGLTGKEINNPDNILINWLKKQPKGLVLDQGCGVGQYTLVINKLGFEVIGLDFSKKLLDQAKKNNDKYKTRCKFICGDIRSMPLQSNQFNIVVSGGIIEHVPQTNKCLRELKRVLKKDGILLIHVPHRVSMFTINKKSQQLLGLCVYSV